MTTPQGYIITANSDYAKGRITLSKRPMSKSQANKRCKKINKLGKFLNINKCKVEKL